MSFLSKNTKLPFLMNPLPLQIVDSGIPYQMIGVFALCPGGAYVAAKVFINSFISSKKPGLVKSHTSSMMSID